MGSDNSLVEFASSQRRGGWAWHSTLDDETYNQIWDALHANMGIGEMKVVAWLQSLGYADATEGKIKTIRFAPRR